MKNDLVVLRRRKQKLQEKEKENNSKMSAALNQHIFSEIVLDFVHNKFDDSQEQKIVTACMFKATTNLTCNCCWLSRGRIHDALQQFPQDP